MKFFVVLLFLLGSNCNISIGQWRNWDKSDAKSKTSDKEIIRITEEHFVKKLIFAIYLNKSAKRR